MSLMSQEKILYESKQGLLKLTSQKVRFNSVRSGSENIISLTEKLGHGDCFRENEEQILCVEINTYGCFA